MGSINKKRKLISKIIYNGNSIFVEWRQTIDIKGKLSGIGHFVIVDKEEASERAKRYKEKNLEKRRESYRKAYRKQKKNDSEKQKEIRKRAGKKLYQTKKGKKAILKSNKIYIQSKKGKEIRKRIDKKYQHKRRGLGFIELNRFFTESHAHHINKEFVIYIPSDLHISIRHNIWTGKNMEMINQETFEWLATQENFKMEYKNKDE